MVSAVIGIGSNSSSSFHAVEDAVLWLKKNFRNVSASSIYATEAYGKPDAPRYHNAVVSINTGYPREMLGKILKQYETDNGRTPEMKALGIVPVDLDIVIYDTEVLRPHEISREYFAKGYRELESHMHADTDTGF